MEKVEMYLQANMDKLPKEKVAELKKQLEAADDATFNRVSSLELKSPKTSIILSIIVGTLGIDRFYLGQILLGVLKLVTCGLSGFWTVIDWFLIMKATRETNYQTIQKSIQGI